MVDSEASEPPPEFLSLPPLLSSPGSAPTSPGNPQAKAGAPPPALIFPVAWPEAKSCLPRSAGPPEAALTGCGSPPLRPPSNLQPARPQESSSRCWLLLAGGGLLSPRRSLGTPGGDPPPSSLQSPSLPPPRPPLAPVGLPGLCCAARSWFLQ